jgi:hypothetical protein
MESQINDRQLPKFRPLLQEDQVYYIKHFLVVTARKVYRQVDNDYMIRFTAFTRVFKLENVPLTFPRYAHRTLSFPTLRSRVGIREFTSGLSTQTNHFPVRILPLLTSSGLYRRDWDIHWVYRSRDAGKSFWCSKAPS